MRGCLLIDDDYNNYDNDNWYLRSHYASYQAIEEVYHTVVKEMTRFYDPSLDLKSFDFT